MSVEIFSGLLAVIEEKTRKQHTCMRESIFPRETGFDPVPFLSAGGSMKMALSCRVIRYRVENYRRGLRGSEVCAVSKGSVVSHYRTQSGMSNPVNFGMCGSSRSAVKPSMANMS